MVTAEKIRERKLQGEADFWRIRELLVRTYPVTPVGFNWEVRNWEGKRLYDESPGWDRRWEAAGRVWETTAGQVLGAVHPDSMGTAVLQLDPGYRRLLEEPMITRAEETIAIPVAAAGKRKRLRFYVFDYDGQRRQLLSARGYQQLSSGGITRRLQFGRDRIPDRRAPVTPYRLRTTRPGNREDAAGIAALLNAAFNRDFHNAAEYLSFSRLAPSFRHELDLVAVAPDGTIAAYVSIPYIETVGHAEFEPVCTHPQHRRKGLARALMVEGLHRLQALGAADVTVATGTKDPANRLYESLGFAEAYRGSYWERTIEGIIG